MVRVSAETPAVANVRRGAAMISPVRLKLNRTVICMPSRAESAGGGDQQARSAAKRSPMFSRSWPGFWYFDTIGDLFAALRSCWSPPPADSAREGMQMTVRFSFKRTGEIIAAPRLTFATAGVSADTRTIYLKGINASLDACEPLKFTSGLGGALAGRPIAIRYVDNRALGKQSGTP